MASLQHTDRPAAKTACDALVIGVAAADHELVPVGEAAAVDRAMKGRLLPALALLGARGAEGEVTKVPTFGALPAPLVVATGLGSRPPGGERFAAEAVRRAAGAAIRALAGTGRVAVALSPGGGADAEVLADVVAVGEGALLGAYEFAGYRSPGADRRPAVQQVFLVAPKVRRRDLQPALHRATTAAGAVTAARDLVNTPPNRLPPAALADAAATMAGAAGCQVEVLDERSLAAGGYGGLLAVGSGSAHPPRLVRVSHRPKRAGRTVALVGKGITFDSGGLTIKPGPGMHEMKSDMSGAAAVLAVVCAAAELDLPVAVDGWLPMAENLPGGGAYRPGDVVTMYGGRTVEVLNTDAEGRMILADAIVRAAEDRPDYLLETSTLTGGQVTALGKRVAGLMGCDGWVERVRAAADRVGEPAWPMPLPEDVRKGMESAIADMSQVDNQYGRAGHMLQGGVFLGSFVPDGLPWAHLDIAGPSYHSGSPYGYVATGGTGVPVRTMLAVLEDVAANG